MLALELMLEHFGFAPVAVRVPPHDGPSEPPRYIYYFHPFGESLRMKSMCNLQSVNGNID